MLIICILEQRKGNTVASHLSFVLIFPITSWRSQGVDYAWLADLSVREGGGHAGMEGISMTDLDQLTNHVAR